MALSTVTLLDSAGVTRTFVVQVNAAGFYSMVGAIATAPPTVLASPNVVAVPTTAGGKLLSAITAGIPTGATHALLSVPPGGGNIYYTEDGSTSPVAGGPGLFVGAGQETEVTNLASIKMISDSGTISVYASFRKY